MRHAQSLLLLLCHLPIVLFTQSAIFKGQIVDQTNQLPLSYANIYNSTSGVGTISNADGYFEISVTTLPTELTISFIGYKDSIYTIEDSTILNQQAIIPIKKSTITLSEIVVSATPITVSLTSDDYSIADFIPFNDKILLLKKVDTFVGYTLSLIDLKGNELNTLSLKKLPHIERLHQGCLGGLYVLTSQMAVEITFDSKGRLSLGDTITNKKVHNLLLPCVMSSSSHIYYQDYQYNGQKIVYSGIDRTTSDQFLLRAIINQNNINLLYTDVNRRRSEKSAMGDLGKEEMMYLRRNQYRYYNTIHLFYKDLNAPIVDTGEEICLFNHLEQQAEFYNYKGGLIRQLPIHYNKQKKWANLLLYDQLHKTSYVVFKHRKGKVIRRFNYQDATLAPDVLIENAFTETMKIHDHTLYYLASNTQQKNKQLKKINLSGLK